MKYWGDQHFMQLIYTYYNIINLTKDKQMKYSIVKQLAKKHGIIFPASTTVANAIKITKQRKENK